MKKDIGAIVFWGAVWGLVEATLGYMLHSLALNIGWLFWFPLAFYFMKKAYTQSGRLSAILYTAFIAAAVKLADFFLPTPVDRVINPAASILLEGLVVFAAFKILELRGKALKLRYLGALAVSLSWRLLYLLYLLPLPAFIVKISPLGEIDALLQFLFLQSVVNSVAIYIYVRAEGKTRQMVFRPAVSFALLILAVFAQLAL